MPGDDLLKQIAAAGAEVRRINAERARAVQARDQLIRQAWSLVATRDIAQAAGISVERAHQIHEGRARGRHVKPTTKE